ncbi:hypothetical protein F5878DRAFT_647662, partial [Lentinula raphanica]
HKGETKLTASSRNYRRNLQNEGNLSTLDHKFPDSLGTTTRIKRSASRKGWLFAALNMEDPAPCIHLRSSLCIEDEPEDVLQPNLDLHNDMNGNSSETGLDGSLPTQKAHGNSEINGSNLTYPGPETSSQTVNIQMIQDSFPIIRALPVSLQAYLFTALAAGTGDLPFISNLHAISDVSAEFPMPEMTASPDMPPGIISTLTFILDSFIDTGYPYSSFAATAWLHTGPGSAAECFAPGTASGDGLAQSGAATSRNADLDGELAANEDVLSTTYTLTFDTMI